jgi:motility quorum-sensing regulator/GCU-specific mRNA interferase toxin
MEKRNSTYDLETIKLSFCTVAKLRVTATALRDARLIGFSREDIMKAIQGIKRSDFLKSMTTYADHRIWQDVYNTSYNGYFLYVKFQIDEEGHFEVSFKEK